MLLLTPPLREHTLGQEDGSLAAVLMLQGDLQRLLSFSAFSCKAEGTDT